MNRIVLLICSLLMVATTAAFDFSDPDLYELVARQPLDNVTAVAQDSFNLYLLFDQSIGIAPLHEPGGTVLVDSTISLSQTYRQVYRAGNWLYLSSEKGGIAVAHITSGGLEIVNEQQMDDSIMSIAGGDRYLYLASGFSGIRIVDAGNRRNLTTIDWIDRGVYYSRLRIYGDKLFAVDPFNGVEIYQIAGSELLYRSTILTEYRPIDLAYCNSHLYVCYGNRELTDFTLDDNDSLLSVSHRQLSRDLYILEDRHDPALLGFAQGVMALYDLAADVIVYTLQLPYPLRQINVGPSAGDGRIVILDASGNVRIVKANSANLQHDRYVDLKGAPVALAVGDDKLLVAAASGGIYQYDFSSGSVQYRLLYPSALIFKAVTISGDLLFAAVDVPSEIWVFDMSTQPLAAIARIEKNLPTNDLIIIAGAESEYQIIAVGSAGAEGFWYNSSSGQYDLLWRQEAVLPVVAGFYHDNLLGLAEADGVLNLYLTAADSVAPQLVVSLLLPDSTRVILPVENEYLILGGSYGVMIDSLPESYDQLVPIAQVDPLEDAFDIAYDSSAGRVLVACGREGVGCFDFAQALQESTICMIFGSAGASRLALAGDYLYAISSTAIMAYRLSETDQPQVALPQDISVSGNYPNPFNGATTIEVTAGQGTILDGRLDFQVYDILGRLVKERSLMVRVPRVLLSWDGTNASNQTMASGIYLLRVEVSGVSVTRKAILLK
ncbi:MAG: T9SS type A sorting domain-containing protein [candidate division Zixibacteria bacterium]|nr:T9SS type A sorting domain-containing protein [candidate division Zixibacteria bacterium]